jgi:hypothetical protein
MNWEIPLLDHNFFLWRKLNNVAVVRKRTIPTERPPFVDEVSANLCRCRVLRIQLNEFPRTFITINNLYLYYLTETWFSGDPL